MLCNGDLYRDLAHSIRQPHGELYTANVTLSQTEVTPLLLQLTYNLDNPFMRLIRTY